MYLGIDVGNKKCGISIFLEGIVIPKSIVPRINIIPTLKNYIQQYNIQVMVVGLPYDLHNKNLKQLEKTKSFIEKLKKIFPKIKIEAIDERFSSWEAETLIGGEKGNKDDISACIILESYLYKIGKTSLKNKNKFAFS